MKMIMETINKNNRVFQCNEYKKDKYLFSVFETKINDENARIMSDGENYVITNESVETPPWIWTKDDFDKSKLKEIEEVIRLYLVKHKMTFTSKQELYNALLDDDFELIDRSDYFELWFMKCERLRDTKPNDGRLDRARPEEKDIIAKYIYNFENFMDNSITNYSSKTPDEIKEDCMKRTEQEMSNPNFYVLRNANDKIVCMARFTIYKDRTGKVWLVYTPDEERGKWYAAKLVHELTKMILEKWYVPVLYTDKNYPNSNKAYANAGYEDGGSLVSFSIVKK